MYRPYAGPYVTGFGDFFLNTPLHSPALSPAIFRFSRETHPFALFATHSDYYFAMRLLCGGGALVCLRNLVYTPNRYMCAVWGQLLAPRCFPVLVTPLVCFLMVFNPEYQWGAHGWVCGVTLQRDPGDFSFSAASVSVAGVWGFICIHRPHLPSGFFSKVDCSK